MPPEWLSSTCWEQYRLHASQGAHPQHTTAQFLISESGIRISKPSADVGTLTLIATWCSATRIPGNDSGVDSFMIGSKQLSGIIHGFGSHHLRSSNQSMHDREIPGRLPERNSQ